MTGTTAGLTPEDFVALRAIDGPSVSDDGTIRLCVVSDPPPRHPQTRRSDIWVARDDAPMAPITNGPGNKTLPRLSPGGRFVAYASDAADAGSARLRVVALADGDAAFVSRSFHQVPGVVEDILWSADESALLVRTLDDDPENGGMRGYMLHVTDAEKAAPVLVRRPLHAWRRVYRVERATGAVRQVSPDHLSVWEIAWAGHGPVAAVVSETPREDGWFDPKVAVLDIDAESATIVYEPEYQVQGLAMSGDGATLAFAESPQSDRGLLAGQVTILDLATGAVARPAHQGDVSVLRWVSDGRLFWTGAVWSESAFGFAERDALGRWSVATTWKGLATLGRGYRVTAACSADGRVVVAAHQAHNVPHEFREFRLDDAAPGTGAWVALTAVNAALVGRARAVESLHRWTSFDGVEIEGILLLPTERPHENLPLVVVPHGGPSNVTTSLFASGAHFGDAVLMAQSGCAVLLPNPRGSTGRGQDFTAANLGDLGGGDLHDIEAGVDSLVASGLVDASRVGIVGVSYGGFMSAWAAVKSDRFVASIPIAGITNWLSFHNTSILQLFGRMFLRGDPYDPAGPYLAHSPIMFVEGCRTATLIAHGDLDIACPIGQAWEFYHGLSEAGCETELAIYQGAGHGLTEAGQMVDLSRRIVGWFATHLALATSSAPEVATV